MLLDLPIFLFVIRPASYISLVLTMKLLVAQCVPVSSYTLFLPRAPYWRTTPFLLSATSYSAYWQTPRVSAGRILLIVLTWTQSLNVIQVYFTSHKLKYLLLRERHLETVRLWVHFPNVITVFFVVTPYILVEVVWIFGGNSRLHRQGLSVMFCLSAEHSIL